MTITIRTAAKADEAAWRGLWAQYLAFYGVTLSDSVTTRTWTRITDPASPLTARMAFDGAGALGFAMHHTHLSTWAEGLDCYLEDLFLAAGARGKGVGRALLDDLVTIAKDRGYARLYWHTDENNVVARRLYDRFTPADGHLRYRMIL